MLAGVYEPTRGKFSLGWVSSLLDFQVGLNGDATGRENIIFVVARTGFTRATCGRRPRRWRSSPRSATIHMPVRTYSAGMMIRLAFAISTCIPPDILIMDEWLSAATRISWKVQRRVEGFVRASSILVLASHSLESLVERWCNRGILLHQGRVLATGPVDEIVAAFRRLVAGGPAPGDQLDNRVAPAWAKKTGAADAKKLHDEIEQLLRDTSHAPLEA